MFTLPSIWNIFISTLVFIVAAWFIRKKLTELELLTGATLNIVVFVLAYIVSTLAGEVVDWAQIQIEGPQAITAQTPEDALESLRKLGL